MIITEFLTIKVHSKTLNHYISKGYDAKVNQNLIVKISDLTTGSTFKIECMCDNPECIDKKVKILAYKDYYNATKNNNHYYCTKCSYIKAHKTCIDRYGDLYTRTDECKEKTKVISIEKFGIDNYAKTEQFKSDFKSYSQQRYGTDNPFQSEEVKEIIKNRHLENLGVEYPTQNKEVFLKGVETLKQNYNVSTPLKSDIIVKRAYQTKYDRYGKSLRRKYNKHIFGDTNYLKTRKLRLEANTKIKYSNIHFSNASYEVLSYVDNKFTVKHSVCDNTFIADKYLVYNRHLLNVEQCTICNPIDSQQSWAEKEIILFVESLGVECIVKDRKILEGKELDIYIPSKNFAIEYNGTFWHSSRFKKDSYNYHINKTNKCLEKGINLFHIWEYDWKDLETKEILKKLITWKILYN